MVVWARAQGSSANGRASQRPCACPVLSAKAAPLLKPPQTDLVQVCCSSCSSCCCWCAAPLCCCCCCCCRCYYCCYYYRYRYRYRCYAASALPCPTQPCPAQPASAQLRSVLLCLLCRDSSSSFACHRQPPGPLPPSLHTHPPLPTTTSTARRIATRLRAPLFSLASREHVVPCFRLIHPGPVIRL